MEFTTNYSADYEWMSTFLGLRNGIRHFYALIYGFTKSGKDCFCSYKTFMNRLRINSRSTISKYIKTLVQKKLIIVERTTGDCNHYRADLNYLESLRKAADSDSEKSDYFFETVVQFSNTGSTFSIPNNKTYNFFYDDDSFSSALSEQERKEEIIKEKENLSLQLNAEQLKTNFDSCLIDDIVEWIATTDCISVHGETIEHEYLKEKFSKLTSQHIAYVIRNVKKHGKGINDKRAYYLAALYKSVDIEFNATKKKKRVLGNKLGNEIRETSHDEAQSISSPYAALTEETEVRKKLRNAGIFDLFMDMFEKNRKYDDYDNALLTEIKSVISWAWKVKKNIYVNSVKMDANAVRQQLNKLNRWHLLFTMDNLRKTNTVPKNRKSYILTALYNAPTQYATSDFNVDEVYPVSGSSSSTVSENNDEPMAIELESHFFPIQPVEES